VYQVKACVREAFVPFTVAFEGGYIGWMFPDVEGKVSTGFGLLLEPVALALALPWRRRDGSLASREEIVADWLRVKNYPDAPRLGHKSVEHVAQLRLDNAGLEQAFQGKLNLHDSIIRDRFPAFEEWPADAQLATHSMAWACGAGAWDPSNPNGFPKMAAALERGDFSGAAVECHMNEWDAGVFNAGLVPRNVANKTLFFNASRAKDPDILYWPRDLLGEPDTIPEVRLDLLESEPPPPPIYAEPDPPKRQIPTYDDGWKPPEE
jgi:hypothetical protein